MGRYRQGKFKPSNPKKYIGDTSNITYRSGWELKLMGFLDRQSNVIRWGSEELIIPYISPIDGRMHRYYTDFIVERINSDKKKEVVVIEVKPAAQTRAPDATNSKTKRGKPRKRFLKEVQTWGVNSAKWKAAEEYCKDRGWQFIIMTEKELGIKK